MASSRRSRCRGQGERRWHSPDLRDFLRRQRHRLIRVLRVEVEEVRVGRVHGGADPGPSPADGSPATELLRPGPESFCLITLSADKLAYATGAGSLATTDFTARDGDFYPFRSQGLTFEPVGANQTRMVSRETYPTPEVREMVLATGMEKDVARNSSMVGRARKAGKVTFVDASRIEIGAEELERAAGGSAASRRRRTRP